MARNAHTASRALLLKEADGALEQAGALRRSVAASELSHRPGSGTSPMIETAQLHGSIRRLQDHLDQLKTLTNFRN